MAEQLTRNEQVRSSILLAGFPRDHRSAPATRIPLGTPTDVPRKPTGCPLPGYTRLGYTRGEERQVQGKEWAWERLAESDPVEVCRRAAVTYSEDQGYEVPLFSLPIIVNPSNRSFTPKGPETQFLLTKLAYFSRLSLLHYLLSAQTLPPTGRLLSPSELSAGQFYSTGSHVLPLDPIASRFSNDPEGFLAQCARFGGEPRGFGDAAAEFFAFPRVPVALILWLEDEEFPPRCSLLFDQIGEVQVPPDILWSIAMMCTLAVLNG